MKIYAIIRDVSGDYANSFDGMTQTTVEGMLDQRMLTYDIVNEEAYNAFLDEQARVKTPPPPPPDLTAAKTTLKDKNAAPSDRLDAVAQILGL